MRASGASIVQVGWAVVRVGIPLAIATFLAGEYVAPPAERLAQTVRAAAMGNATGVVAQQFDSRLLVQAGPARSSTSARCSPT